MVEPVVMFDSPEAAQRVEVVLWKSRTGSLYEDEETARYVGCTHQTCETCENVNRRGLRFCRVCSELRDAAAHAKRERKPWDGEQMVYSEALNKWFHDPDEAEAWAIEEGRALESLRLVLSDPVDLREVDDDYWMDEMYEDGELPAEIEAARQALNEAIRKHGRKFTWYPNKYALEIAATPQSLDGGESR